VQRIAQVAFQDGLQVILERWEARIPPAEPQGSNASNRTSSPPLPTPLKTPPRRDHQDTHWVDRDDVSPTLRSRGLPLPSPPDSGAFSLPRARFIDLDAATQRDRGLQLYGSSPSIRRSAGIQPVEHVIDLTFESLNTLPTWGDNSFNFDDDGLFGDFDDSVLLGDFPDGHECSVET
jgi:hypothetical protein